MVVIVDYGMGNLRSVEKAFLKLGVGVKTTRDKKEIKNSKALVVPGVGSYPVCMRNLKKTELDKLILEHIFARKPYLGICLGMQILFTRSDEDGGAAGLDVLKGEVIKFPSHLKVPHIGWNTVKFKIQKSKILKNIPDGSYFYFVHSYYVVPEDKNIILTTTEYGIEFTSAILKDNIIACQFHPEKSQDHGLKFLSNFWETVCLQKE